MQAAPAARYILVLNAGSSSIKFAVFDTGGPETSRPGLDLGPLPPDGGPRVKPGAGEPATRSELTERLSGLAGEIGGASFLRIGTTEEALPLPTHRAALETILARLETHGFPLSTIRAAAHRVVHGGRKLTAPVCLTAAIRTEIAACSPLAPLHNPHNLAAIDTLTEIDPNLPQFASFDTSFHATNPEVATRYAIPRVEETKGIRRYGFHGLSYASLAHHLPLISGAPLPRRLLAFHLGNGASLCAILEGRSIATTMGYSPIDGLTMGTRSGGIDANAVLRLVEDHGLEETRNILNFGSGLRGLGGKSDMRRLMRDHTTKSDFAIEHFCYWSLRHAGSLIAAMEGLDAIAFTGGIGENAVGIRARICRGLEWLGLRFDASANHASRPRLDAPGSKISVWIVPAREEEMIARDALSLMAAA